MKKLGKIILYYKFINIKKINFYSEHFFVRLSEMKNRFISMFFFFQMSFLGNWCFKTEPPILPCEKQWLGRGPIQDVTTQRHDYTWKNIPLDPDLRYHDNLVPATSPIESM